MNQQCVAGWRGLVKITTPRSPIFTDPEQFTTIPVVRWAVNFMTDLDDVTAGTERIKQWIEAYTDVEVTLDCLWMGGLEVFGTNDSRLNITTGQIIKVYLYIDANDPGSFFILPQVIVTRVSMEEGVRDVARYTLVGKQTSSYGPSSTSGPTNILTYPTR